MAVNSKHIATFILGAAAGLAAAKYMSMTDEEKDKLTSDLKDKANKFKGEAEDTWDKAKDYFDELKTKGTDAIKEHLADAENLMNEVFSKNKTSPENTNS